MPSLTPTLEPSLIPTAKPSLIPTSQPSLEPTSQPSLMHTLEPSLIPTAKPLLIPTSQPSLTPTSEPSLTPTINPTQSPTLSLSVCNSWCPTGDNTWEIKCQWDSCSGCTECASTFDSSDDLDDCDDFCETSTAPWWQKCGWIDCEGCTACETAVSTDGQCRAYQSCSYCECDNTDEVNVSNVAECMQFAINAGLDYFTYRQQETKCRLPTNSVQDCVTNRIPADTPWVVYEVTCVCADSCSTGNVFQECSLDKCMGCDWCSTISECTVCDDQPSPNMILADQDCSTIDAHKQCDWANFRTNHYCAQTCYSEGYGHDGDNCCSSVARFLDVTSQAFSYDHNWNMPGGLGFPLNWENTAQFPDWNEDGVLDIFDNCHFKQHPEYEWNLGVASGSHDDYDNWVFQNVSSETIIYTDPGHYKIDGHGSTFLDIDGDGITDLYVTQGGGSDSEWSTDSIKSGYRDAMLFWGEIDADGNKKLRGGKEVAREAGLECNNCRGRIAYWGDFNQDGMLDAFMHVDRRRSNLNIIGRLMLNQGSRKFVAEQVMMEYSRTALLHDADGDGYAEEFVLQRGACLPMVEDTSTYLQERIEFCSTRPQGTTAVYKFIDGSMELISPVFTSTLATETLADEHWCAHGEHINPICHATSSASMDIDNDQKSDLIVLFQERLLFFHSSDRTDGSMPLVNNPSATIDLGSICHAFSVRVIDFDLDGQEEILIHCKAAGDHMLYKYIDGEWVLETDSMGNLNNRNIAHPTKEDYDLVCSNFDGSPESARYGAWTYNNVCDVYNGRLSDVSGLSVVDLNNDGFMDVFITQWWGYGKILRNIPPNDNKYICFRLRGTESNYYGIGATMILEAENMQHQFREINTYGHAPDKYGNTDDRIVFGLGSSGVPSSLTVRWPAPGHHKQIIDLTTWNPEGSGTMADPFIVLEARI